MAEGTELSPAVRHFVREHIQSLEQLEVLLLLRSDPSRNWTVQSVYERVLSNERSISQRLFAFTAQGFLVSEGSPETFRYRPRTAELDKMVSELDEAYRTRRVMVTEAIFRPESTPAQSFADAFKWRNRK